MEFDSLVICGAGYFAYASVGSPIHQEDCGNLAVLLSRLGEKHHCCFRSALVDWEQEERQSKSECLIASQSRASRRSHFLCQWESMRRSAAGISVVDEV